MANWFITGVSRGLGLALAEAVLDAGDSVIGTTRSGGTPETLLGRAIEIHALDMVDVDRMKEVVEKVFSEGTRVDFLVNNAGYGLLGSVESSTDAELEHLFDVDVFAPIRIVRTALPYLRAKGAGHIVNITSVAGRAPGVGTALYASAKHALEGFSVALAAEVKHLGIGVTAIAPGQFRTDFLSTGSARFSATADDAYRLTVGAALDTLGKANHQQLGDPKAAARVILDTLKSDNPPLQLVLGSDALRRIRGRIKETLGELEAWEAVSIKTDYVQ